MRSLTELLCRHVPGAVATTIVQSHMTDVCMKDGNDLRFGIPAGNSVLNWCMGKIEAGRSPSNARTPMQTSRRSISNEYTVTAIRTFIYPDDAVIQAMTSPAFRSGGKTG